MFKAISLPVAVVNVSIAALVWLNTPQLLPAAEQPTGGKEVREFEVLLKGRPTGSTKITIEQLPGQRIVATTDVAVQVNVLVYNYSFNFHGSQTWVGDRLEKFDGSTNDNGKRSTLSGVVNPDKSEVVVNNKHHAAPVFAMTNDYWRLPMQRGPNDPYPIIDTATGVTKNIKITKMGESKVTLGKSTIACTEYRLSGDVDVHLWLDAQGRVVRQQSVEDGHHTELRLTRIYRVEGATAARQ